MTGNPGPGYAKKPDHKITLEKEPKRVQVRFGGEVVVDTLDALVMRESNHGPVYYFSRSDARMEKFHRTDHSSYCPFKGKASYFSLSTAENAVWSYETPYDEMLEIKERLAFYPDKVEINLG